MMTASVLAASMTVHVEVGRLHKARTPKPHKAGRASENPSRHGKGSEHQLADERVQRTVGSGLGQHRPAESETSKAAHRHDRGVTL